MLERKGQRVVPASLRLRRGPDADIPRRREIAETWLFRGDTEVRSRPACASGTFLNCSPDDLVLVDNASNAINVLLARLGLSADPLNSTYPVGGAPGGVLLALSVAYGPFVGFYDWLAATRNVEVVYANLTFPATDDELVQAIEETLAARKAAGLTMPQVSVIDQVASVPALVLPVAKMTDALHSYGIPVVVDGAHALGNVPCDLSGDDGSLGKVDAWFGNAHKWLMAPKSAAVLYVRRDRHDDAGTWPEPTVVDSYGDDFSTRFVWDGTRDRSPFLSISDSIDWRESLGGEDAIMARVRRAGRSESRRSRGGAGSRPADAVGTTINWRRTPATSSPRCGTRPCSTARRLNGIPC